MGYLNGAAIGSHSGQALPFEPHRGAVASGGPPAVVSHPGTGEGWHGPAQRRDGLAAAVRQVLAAAGMRPADGTHLGLASQVDGVVPVDRALMPLRDAIIWLDRRAADEAAALAAKLGTDAIFAVTGLNADSSH